MAQFDPISATATYLGSIDPALVAKAEAFTRGEHWTLIGGKLATIIACVVVLRSGVLRRISERVSSGGSRPAGGSFVGALAFMAALWIVLLPLQAYTEWYREVSFGLSTASLAAWLGGAALQSAISNVIVAALLAGLLWLMRKTRWWSAWCSAIAVIVGITAVAILPALVPTSSEYRQVPEGTARASIMQLAAKAGLRGEAIKVFKDPAHARMYTASVTGIGSIHTIAVSEAVLRPPVDLPAVRAVVAHEIGHYRHWHLILLGLLVGLLISIGLILLDRIFDGLARLLSGREAPPLKGEATSIPVIIAFFAAFTLLTTPLVNTGMRTVENDADRFGLALAREPEGTARALLATVEYRAPSPSPLEETLFYDHPSIATRIRTAMEWKARYLPRSDIRRATDPQPLLG